LPAGIVALWLSWGPNFAPNIPNDGYQYLDAASSLAAGQCLCTRVALFDEQVAYGHFPIPFTHFAPGYPILIAAVSRAGIGPATAGYMLSALGFLVSLWLLQEIALGLGARQWLAYGFSLVWLIDPTALLYASTVGTESLFTALLLALVALIVRDARVPGPSRALPLWIGMIAGSSYAIRYPGLFLAAAAIVYLAVRFWRVPHNRVRSAAGLALTVVIVGSVQIRNMIYTGSWRGGFSAGGRHAARTVLADSARAFFHLIVGDRVALHAILPLLAGFAASAAIVLFLAATGRKTNPHGAEVASKPLWWAVFIGLTYVGGVVAAALTTIAADFPRYYFPVYPLLLAFAAVLCSVASGGFRGIAVALLLASLIGLQTRNLFIRPPQPDWVLARSLLAEETAPGVPLLEWLREHIRPDESIVAAEGQALYYLLGRPVVAVIGASDTSRSTSEDGFHTKMRQFRSEYMVLFPGAPAERVSEQNSYQFLRDLASGIAPAWLIPVTRSRDAVVYECTDCIR
jgi:hypothetical protein